MKRYIDWASVYAVLALIGGVFFREFTKFNGFAGDTTLSVVHTHYFVLGMVLFLLLTVLEKNFAFTGAKTKRALLAYNAGLNLTVLALAVRGVLQVRGTVLSLGANASLSGLAGVGHMLLAAGLIVLLLQVRRAVRSAERVAG